ncbi:MAG: hypothetical protein AABZ58_03210, partial [Chloroflexota bacterium]
AGTTNVPLARLFPNSEATAPGLMIPLPEKLAPLTIPLELIAAALQRAAECRPMEERERFLKEAGRELAKLLSRDLARLENLLRRIRP